jgi:hypothetical protein
MELKRYGEDETVVIVSGEVFIRTKKGEESRLGQRDMGFFPAGTSCLWRINHRVKKVAILRKDLPPPLGIGLRAWHKFLRVAGLRGQSPLSSWSFSHATLWRLHEPAGRRAAETWRVFAGADFDKETAKSACKLSNDGHFYPIAYFVLRVHQVV